MLRFSLVRSLSSFNSFSIVYPRKIENCSTIDWNENFKFSSVFSSLSPQFNDEDENTPVINNDDDTMWCWWWNETRCYGSNGIEHGKSFNSHLNYLWFVPRVFSVVSSFVVSTSTRVWTFNQCRFCSDFSFCFSCQSNNSCWWWR